jgi:hypothetical protein
MSAIPFQALVRQRGAATAPATKMRSPRRASRGVPAQAFSCRGEERGEQERDARNGIEVASPACDSRARRNRIGVTTADALHSIGTIARCERPWEWPVTPNTARPIPARMIDSLLSGSGFSCHGQRHEISGD